MAKRPTRDEVLALAQKVCDETITPDERDRLEEMLLDNHELVGDYVDYLSVNAALISRYRTGDSSTSSQPQNTLLTESFAETSKRFAAWATFFAMTACLLLAAWLYPAPDTTTVANNIQPIDGPIATLRDSSVAVWRDSEQPLNVGERFASGVLSIDRGHADMILDSGVRLLLQGPAKLEISTPDDAFLFSGKVAVHVPEQAIGFTLLTPTSKLIDQGTEFGVVAEESGATEVHVFRGQVDLVYSANDQPGVESRLALMGRQARRVDESNSLGHGVDFSLDRFRGLADRINEPIKWSLSEGGNDHYYQLVLFDRSVPWQEAATIAFERHHKGMPGHLVTVTSEEENQFLLDQLLSNRKIDNVWIGLTDVVREGFYQWITGEPFAYERWGLIPTPQPDNYIERAGHGGEDYGTFSLLPGHDWFWNDLSNDSNTQSVAAAIIEYEPPSQPIQNRTVMSVPVTWGLNEGGNGHVYRLVLSLQTLDWDEVVERAEATSILGVPGALASLETQEEREFVKDRILKVCGISENLVGLRETDSQQGLTWLTGEPLGDVERTAPNFPTENEYGEYRWVNQSWQLHTVPMSRVPPGWFGYLIEYPTEQPE